MSRSGLDKLAIDGGRPVRSRPLPPYYPGAMVIGAAERKAVLSVIDARSPFRYYGPHLLGKAQRFERAFARYMGVRYALGVTSGTAALRVAVEALEIGPGDEVIIPAVTFVASPNSVVCARAIPVFADVDESLSLDPCDFEKRITPRTKAVMPVAILGVSPRMDRIRQVARRHKIAVIEDVAQSCGATFRGRHLGSFGDASTFSLQLNKIITAGEGGVVTTNSATTYERAVRYHDQGQVRKPHADLLGRLRLEPFAGENYRMSEITGAIAAAQLHKLPAILKKMRAARARLEAAVKLMTRLMIRPSHDHAGDAGSSLMFFLEDPAAAAWFAEALRAENVQAFQLYDGTPAYLFPQVLGKGVVSRVKCPYECPHYGETVDYRPGLCPNAESLLKRSVGIGLTPVLGASDVRDIIAAIRKVYSALY